MSLNIINYISSDIDCYCGNCTSTDIAKTDINKWETAYYAMYHKYYIPNTNMLAREEQQKDPANKKAFDDNYIRY